jgi:hypothetical protein
MESPEDDVPGLIFDIVLRGELERIEEYKDADLSPYLPLLSRLVYVQERCQVSNCPRKAQQQRPDGLIDCEITGWAS